MSIDYKALTATAMLNVVREALTVASQDADPGEFYFEIVLDTTDANVVIPNWLRAQYPECLMIVLNQQFDNLVVHVTYFSVTVYFGGKPVRIDAPFDAIMGFNDEFNDFKVGFITDRNGEQRENYDPVDTTGSEEDGSANSNIVSFDDFKNKT